MRPKTCLAALTILLTLPWINSAHAYIAVSATRLTLPEVMLEFPTIVVLQLDRMDAEKGAYLFSVKETLQGKPPASVKHILRLDGRVPDRLARLKPGDTLVSFMGSPDNRSLTLCGTSWYLTTPDGNWERLTQFRDDFQVLFAGSPNQLASAIRTLTLGGSVETGVEVPNEKNDTLARVRYDAAFPHRRFPALQNSLTNPANKRTLENLQLNLASASSCARQQALLELAERFADNPQTAPLLLKSLTDKQPEVRLAAVYALARIPATTPEILKALAKSLDDEDRFVCAFAAYALSVRGPSAKPALKSLAAALKDRNFDYDFRPHRAAEAAEAILKIDPASEFAEPALALLTSNRMLNDDRKDREGTPAAAARALGRCGKAAAPALPDLLKRLADHDPTTRIAVAEAILLIGGTPDQRTQATTTLTAELQSPDPATRIRTYRALANTHSTKILPTLQKLPPEKSPEAQSALAEAIKTLSTPSK